MSYSCVELEIQHGQGQCKCVHYREHFPECACAQGSVSDHSLGPVEDGEVLVRTVFRDDAVGPDGRPKPSFFRRDPTSRGFSIDRMRIVNPQSLVANKKADDRYTGYLAFIAARGGAARALRTDDGTRLFCLCDTATADNKAHADICQNVHLDLDRLDGYSEQVERLFALAHRGCPRICLEKSEDCEKIGENAVFHAKISNLQVR